MPLQRSTNPLLTPWPPGVDHRIVTLKNGETVFQLRPGASLPKGVYLEFMRQARDAVMVCAWWAFRIGNVDDIDRKMMHAAVEHLIRPGYQVADLLATIDCYYSWQCDRARFSFKPFARWARYDSPVPWLYRACDENDYRRVLDAMRNQRVPLQSPATVRSLDVPDARARRREALPILFGTGLACRRIGREPPGNRPFRLESGAGVSHGRDYFRAASKAGSSAEADVRSGLILQCFAAIPPALADSVSRTLPSAKPCPFHVRCPIPKVLRIARKSFQVHELRILRAQNLGNFTRDLTLRHAEPLNCEISRNSCPYNDLRASRICAEPWSL